MKKLTLQNLELINGGDKCARLKRRYDRTSGHRSAKTFAKALVNECDWTDPE